jgi:NADPH2:quinone reductase
MSMKAAVYYENGGPEVFRIEEVPDPEVHPRGIVIDVEAISIEGGDLLHRAGTPLPSAPHIVGYQAGGTVSAVGEAVTDFKVGDRAVATMGAGSHAAKVAVPARSAWKIPDGLSMDEGATVPIAFGTAHDCLFEFGHLTEGETVLIHGAAGGVGLAAVQLAKRAGARVLGTASEDWKLDRLKEYGLDDGINYRTENWVERARHLTEGRGINLIVDPVGGHLISQDAISLAYRGRISLVGNASRGDRNFDPGLLLQKNASLTGVFLGAEMGTDRAYNMIAQLMDDVASGELKVVLDKTFSLDDAAEAHRYIESRQAFGRVIMKP